MGWLELEQKGFSRLSVRPMSFNPEAEEGENKFLQFI